MTVKNLLTYVIESSESDVMHAICSCTQELRAAGAEVVACVSVNDPFVMREWGLAQKVEDKVNVNRMNAHASPWLHSSAGISSSLNLTVP